MITELRAHSAFSFGDGAVTPESLVTRAAELGYSALGLTDAADLGGTVRFVLEARKRGVKALVGAELEVDGHPVAFLARTAEGYRNLASLVTRARSGPLASWRRERPHVPRGMPAVRWADVAERSAGLHALTGPAAGRVAVLVRQGDTAGAVRHLAQLRELFGNSLAVEVQRHHAGAREAELADALIALAERTGVPWVACQDPRYLDNRSRLVHDMLTALRAGLTLEAAARAGALLPNGRWRLLPPGELRALWADDPVGLDAANRIAAECDFDLSWMRPPLPRFPVPEGHTDDSFLRQCVEEGARARWGTISPAQAAQLDHELGVIGRLGFAGFFLVMWDAVRHARTRNILCQGRGSAANSAVAYCLGVTAVDPVRHGLLFERFLSETRVDGLSEAPDIDLDIEHDRREEVLDYAYDRWDRSRAAIACTVQHYRAPNALLDAMRVLGYPVEQAHLLSKRVHYLEAADGAEQLRALAPRFGLALDDARGRALLALMGGCDALPRMRSTHVGGFVLSAEPLGDYLPVEPTTMGRTIVQFDKDDLDAIGVPKFDFLGLGALSLVRRSFDVIERRTGVRPEIYHLPPDDPATYALISSGETIGTFQIESRAQISSILRTRPEHLYDLVVQVALIRPGPIQARFVHPYTMRRRGREPVTYVHPRLEPILARTQGIPIFQEQAMAVAMALGGYSAAEADALRRTMGHNRKRQRLLDELGRLCARMVGEGIEPEVAKQITADLESFGSYGFPESHAWSFALIAYATAWLKRHHPAEFYLGLLNSWPMGFYPPSTLIHDAKRQGVEVRPPCTCHGDWECTVEETTDPARPALRIGWRHIRGVGTRALDALRAGRAGGPFRSIEDVIRRSSLGRTEALGLAQAGAFAAWQPDRRRAAWEALRAVGDALPLAPADAAPHDPRPLDRTELIFLDYATTGVSLHGHPMEHVRERLRAAGALDSAQLARRRGGQVLVGGLVTIRQRPATANGTIFLLLEDEHGFINVVVPRQLVEPNAEVVKFAPFILVRGRLEREGKVINVVGREFLALEAAAVVHTSRDFR
ncbi:MAG: DNA polymerase III subunit alpha [Gemmatimonadota bacterium]